MANSPKITSTSATPLQAILEWSMLLPLWQRDGLRRIVVQGELAAADIDELEKLCKVGRGVKVDAPVDALPKSIPLTKEDVPGRDAASSISLCRLGSLTRVNRIPSDQTLVFGSAPGLTVVYGENGAGKSGYARVIKKLCRTRGQPPQIKPDAFAASSKAKASAEVVFRVGTVETPVKWIDGAPADPRLSNVFVFDSHSAQVHVEADGPASFIPRGLDVLPKLARACDEIKRRLQDAIDREEHLIGAAASQWNRRPDSTVGRLLASLNAQTPVEKVESTANYSVADDARLKELSAALKDDPKVKSRQTAQMASRIRQFAGALKTRESAISDAESGKIKSALEESAAAERAAQAVASKMNPADLPGTYSDPWRRLWEIARDYAVNVAVKGKPFPDLSPEGRCVLCQQSLADDAKARFVRFDEHVRDEVRVRARHAKETVAAIEESLLSQAPLAGGYESISADVAAVSSEKSTAAEVEIEALDVRLALLQSNLKSGIWTATASMPLSSLDGLLAVAEILDQRAALELSLDDPAERARRTAERDDLIDKAWLSTSKKSVLAVIERRRTIAALKKCQDDVKSKPVTDKSSELYEAFATRAFIEKFEEECKALGLGSIKVKMEAVRDRKAERCFGIRLDGASSAKVDEVASEGEHRCIALAAFLAELSQASHRSALVLDDPVSSLDHKRRDAIARRLVAEATVRQVIVFTHDLSFVCDLDVAAEDQSLEMSCQFLEWKAGMPGRVQDGLPWDAKKPKEQMKTLREQVGHLKRPFRESGESEYREAAMPVVDRIRGACERIVEEQLFNRVVRRNDSKITVGYLESVAVVTRDQYRTVHRVWRECSNIIESHSKPRAGRVTVPDPDVLASWVQDLESLIDAVRKARESGKSSAPAPSATSTSAAAERR